MDSVALVRFERDSKRTLEIGLDFLGGFRNLESPVLIKPNICTISDDTGHSVTDVGVIESLINLLLQEDKDLSIKIIESDSQSKTAEEAFVKFGYNELEDKMQENGHDVSLVNLSKPPLVKVAINASYFKELEINNLLCVPHYFISVAVAKTHYLTFLTGVLKNQFGLLPRKDQGFYHSHIDDVIVDLNRFIKPNLCIVDGRVGIEGWNGPKTRDIGTFILGYNPVSVDAVLAQVMGFIPEQVRHLIESSKHSLGLLNPTILGESIENTQVRFNPPSA